MFDPNISNKRAPCVIHLGQQYTVTTKEVALDVTELYLTYFAAKIEVRQCYNNMFDPNKRAACVIYLSQQYTLTSKKVALEVKQYHNNIVK